LTAQASQVRARAWRRVSWMWHGHFPAHRPAVCRGKRFGLVEMGEPFPVLQKLVKAEAAAAQRGCRVAAESSGEGEPDRFLVFLGKTGLAAKVRPPSAVHCRTCSGSAAPSRNDKRAP